MLGSALEDAFEALASGGGLLRLQVELRKIGGGRKKGRVELSAWLKLSRARVTSCLPR